MKECVWGGNEEMYAWGSEKVNLEGRCVKVKNLSMKMFIKRSLIWHKAMKMEHLVKMKLIRNDM